MGNWEPFDYEDQPEGQQTYTRPRVGARRWARRTVLVITALAVLTWLPATVLVWVWTGPDWGITVLASYALVILLLGAVGAVIDGTLRL